MIAFGIASVLLAIGIVLRAKTKIFQSILMLAPVIGGIVGLILINIWGERVNFVTTKDFSVIVDTFFVLSFIAVGLGNKKNEEKLSRKEKKNYLKKKEKSLRVRAL